MKQGNVRLHRDRVAHLPAHWAHLCLVSAVFDCILWCVLACQICSITVSWCCPFKENILNVRNFELEDEVLSCSQCTTKNAATAATETETTFTVDAIREHCLLSRDDVLLNAQLPGALDCSDASLACDGSRDSSGFPKRSGISPVRACRARAPRLPRFWPGQMQQYSQAEPNC